MKVTVAWHGWRFHVMRFSAWICGGRAPVEVEMEPHEIDGLIAQRRGLRRAAAMGEPTLAPGIGKDMPS